MLKICPARRWSWVFQEQPSTKNGQGNAPALIIFSPPFKSQNFTKPNDKWFSWLRRWWRMQVNIWKIIYLNCGERYENMIDHRSYVHNVSSREIKAWKNFRPERDSNAWPLRYRCSALPTELSSQLGANYLVTSLYTRRWWWNCLTAWFFFSGLNFTIT